MSSQNPTSASGLNSRSPPPSYGAFWPGDRVSPHGSSPHPRSSSFAAPGPTTSWSPRSRSKLSGPAEERIFPAICLAVALFLIISALAVYHSPSLATCTDFKSRAHRASEEASALVEQRERWERKKEDMRHDREVWERMSKKRPLPGSSWYSIRRLPECYAYGKRVYEGELRNIPEGWSDMDACMNEPVLIRVSGGWPVVGIEHPYRCAFQDESSSILGYWIVDWGQDDCKPVLRDINDTGCTNHGSGLARIEARVVGMADRNWQMMCETTPFTWGGIDYTSPTRCEERESGTKVAVWDVPAESCR